MLSKKDILKALDPYAPSPPLGLLAPAADTFAPLLSQQVRALLVAAGQQAALPVPQLPYTALHQYGDETQATAYRAAYTARRDRLCIFTLAQWLRPRGGWLTALEDTLWQISTEPFWCHPHPLDADSDPIPQQNWDTCLDTAACDTALLLAESLVLNKDKISEETATQITEQVHRRVLGPLASGAPLSCKNNGGPKAAICASALGATALYLSPEPIGLPNTLHRVLDVLQAWMEAHNEEGLPIFPSAGWGLEFSYFVVFAEMLARRTQNRLDLLAAPTAQALITTYYKIWSQLRKPYPVGIGCFLQQRYPSIELPELNQAGALYGEGHSLCLAVRDIAWFRADTRFGTLPGGSTWFADSGFLLSKGGVFTLAAHSAHGGPLQGGLLLQKGDTILLQGTLDTHTQNLPLINGYAAIAEANAEPASAEIGTQQDIFTCSLAPYYEDPTLQSYMRGVAHEKHGNFLYLRDEFEFSQLGQVCDIFTSPQPFTIMDRTIQVGSAHTGAKMSYDPVLFEAHTLSQNVTAPDGSSQVFHVLQLRSRAPSKHIVFHSQIR